ncbi:esterase [Cupriavidus sp. USMAA2-4]|uniref:polyhydroxyalkanoate depolymerase n=1 Tax=Cupriavidus sp. USMAA2-4 TaxID=876364 RepID=UPI0008A6C671|nr:polyhydroxyalkanoate depolymerase [Cupriavidus sp. USMAA2-4]AOY96283.1 esterase [Cupriavidus sp. USMAA2-4]
MLYQLLEYQRSLLTPVSDWASELTRAFADPDSPLARMPGAPCVAAGCDMLARLGREYGKPDFAIASVPDGARELPIQEQVITERPFCRLLRFAPPPAAVAATRPAVLLCAPLAGHHAVLLREVVSTLLPLCDVYVTDWIDAREVPLSAGSFHLDDYVAYLQDFLRAIEAPSRHLLAVCQATVPALAAVSLLASAGEPLPASLTLVGGPIDARENPTAVDRLALRQPLSWFARHLIHTVPPRYAGAGRRVYPSFLQHAGLVAAHPSRLMGSHWDYYMDLMQGDRAAAALHLRTCDEYNAVIDMAAEFYLDTIRIVFQEFRLARGDWSVGGRPVRPQDIRGIELLTVEGELDDIAGPGQTRAAADLCSGLAARHKHHLMVAGSGHYELFTGPRWRDEVFPAVAALLTAA